MNDVEKILKWIREVDVKSLPYNVIGIGWGRKEKNGIKTDEYGVIFTVNSKKPFEELKPEEIIPKNLEITLNDPQTDILSSLTFKTDVKEPILHQKIVSYCHTPSNTINPVKEHRDRTRTLIGGIETSSNWGKIVGTLGIFVKDKTDGQIVALSNNHVFANSQLTSLFQTPNEQGTTTTLEISGFQPSGYWKTTPENDYIGKCKRAVMIGDENPEILYYINSTPIIWRTSSDAAILELSNYNLIDSISSPNILNFDEVAPFEFASDAEIDSLAPGASNSGSPIFRSGRTLGPIGYPGNTFSCNLSVSELNLALVAPYSYYGSWFPNCFYVDGDVVAGAGGDSGSALFALFNEGNPALSAWKLVGLLFAGGDNYTIGCRITEIASALNIAPWNTDIPTLSSQKTVISLKDDYSQTVTLSGRKFYQAGFIH